MLLLTMLLLTSSVNTTSSSDGAPCAADDISCLRRVLLEKAIEAESLGRQLATSMQQTKTANELIDAWKEQAVRAHDATKEAMAALKPMPWYREPVLWFAVGFTVAAGLVVGLVYGLAPAFK